MTPNTYIFIRMICPHSHTSLSSLIMNIFHQLHHLSTFKNRLIDVHPKGADQHKNLRDDCNFIRQQHFRLFYSSIKLKIYWVERSFSKAILRSYHWIDHWLPLRVSIIAKTTTYDKHALWSWSQLTLQHCNNISRNFQTILSRNSISNENNFASGNYIYTISIFYLLHDVLMLYKVFNLCWSYNIYVLNFFSSHSYSQPFVS